MAVAVPLLFDVSRVWSWSSAGVYLIVFFFLMCIFVHLCILIGFAGPFEFLNNESVSMMPSHTACGGDIKYEGTRVWKQHPLQLYNYMYSTVL